MCWARPPPGRGLRVQGKLTEALTLGFGYGSGDAGSAEIFDHGFGLAELDYKVTMGNLEGNHRGYATVDGAAPDGVRKLAEKNAFGYGFSVDQQVSENLTLFGRYGWHDGKVYQTQSAWSAGFQYTGLIPQRKEDVAGFGYGQILANGTSAQKKLPEAYYRVKISDQIAMSHVQYLINSLGNKDADNVIAMGLRTQIQLLTWLHR